MRRAVVFLIRFDRRKQRILLFKPFDDAQRADAERLRLDLEIEANRSKLDHEVVLLEAQSEEDIRRTHRRYFESLKELVARGA